MEMKNQDRGSNKTFEPLEIMGVFWIFFGVIVLLATLFVKGTENVPLIRGVVTNVIAGLLLLAAGIFSFLKGRSNKRRKSGES
jgi:predicted metal-binding membrane protein